MLCIRRRRAEHFKISYDIISRFNAFQIGFSESIMPFKSVEAQVRSHSDSIKGEPMLSELQLIDGKQLLLEATETTYGVLLVPSSPFSVGTGPQHNRILGVYLNFRFFLFLIITIFTSASWKYGVSYFVMFKIFYHDFIIISNGSFL